MVTAPLLSVKEKSPVLYVVAAEAVNDVLCTISEKTNFAGEVTDVTTAINATTEATVFLNLTIIIILH